MSHSEPDGWKERKRQQTAARIAASAAELAAQHGLAGATVDRIAADAQIARATFFRYYQSKEHAIAEGITGPWRALLTEAIAAQPAELGPMDAVIAAFEGLAALLPDHEQQIREVATLTRTSTTVDAWVRRAYDRYEQAVAELMVTRITGLTADDPRPRMIAALVMAAVRIGLDDWIRTGRPLPELMRGALGCIAVDSS